MKSVKLFAFLFALVMLAGCCRGAAPTEATPAPVEATPAPTPEEIEAAPEIRTDVADIGKYGNLELTLTATDLFAMGYECGDIVNVTVNGQVLTMPIGSAFSDVDTGSMLVVSVIDGQSGKNPVVVAINMGDLATTLQLAEKTQIAEEPGYRWDFRVSTPVAVAISMQEKGGYLNEYMLRQLVRTNEREDYIHLTDEQFANFRNIATTGMGDWKLYRSSSPVSPELNRNHEADDALNDAGINTIMNLTDTEASMQAYEGYWESYYSRRNIIALNVSVDFESESFKAGLAKGLAFFATHDGPYLIHCKEGKDRAGFVSAVLECLMGASANEVVADYMITYYNYYGVEPGTDQYRAIAAGNIEKTLAAAFGVADIYTADLAACAEQYVKGLGLSDEMIAALKKNLGTPFVEPER